MRKTNNDNEKKLYMKINKVVQKKDYYISIVRFNKKKMFFYKKIIIFLLVYVFQCVIASL